MPNEFPANQNQKDQGSESDMISKGQKEWHEKFFKMHLLHHYLDDFLTITYVSSH